VAEDNTLTKALVDVRARRAALQEDYERIAAELTKLRAAEAALTSIVEGLPLDETGHLRARNAPRTTAEDHAAPQQGGRRGARGPRANSAKGRLKSLLGSAGPQGLSHAEIAERLPDVAPTTLNTYLSMMVTGGEATRKGDFFTAAAGTADASDEAGDEPDAAEDDSADDESRGDAAPE
jgi:hypothetical protein